MKYFFGFRVVVEPIRLQRMEAERRDEANFSFGHHAHPMRRMSDELSIRSEVEAPHGLTDPQKAALERALNRMVRDLRTYIADEFDQMEAD